jgi:hypothetical protein
MILGHKKVFNLVIKKHSGLLVNSLYRVNHLEDDVYYRTRIINLTWNFPGFPKHDKKRIIVAAMEAPDFEWNCVFGPKGEIIENDYRLLTMEWSKQQIMDKKKLITGWALFHKEYSENSMAADHQEVMLRLNRQIGNATTIPYHITDETLIGMDDYGHKKLKVPADENGEVAWEAAYVTANTEKIQRITVEK